MLNCSSYTQILLGLKLKIRGLGLGLSGLDYSLHHWPTCN